MKASTTSLSNLFLCLTILIIINFFFIYSLNLFSFTSKPITLIISQEALLKICSHLSYKPRLDTGRCSKISLEPYLFLDEPHQLPQPVFTGAQGWSQGFSGAYQHQWLQEPGAAAKGLLSVERLKASLWSVVSPTCSGLWISPRKEGRVGACFLSCHQPKNQILHIFCNSPPFPPYSIDGGDGPGLSMGSAQTHCTWAAQRHDCTRLDVESETVAVFKSMFIWF